ncbi:MAG: CDP-alcohol phosphatidyltransferase family protein [Alphaproteobacteria bacterium]
MFDAQARKIIDPPLNQMGRYLAAGGVKANTITVAGFAIGMLAIPLLAGQYYTLALVVILLNRLGDGIDGAVARAPRAQGNGVTDLGGYLDIVLDFIFYAGVVFGFALADPANSVAAALLLFSFIGTTSTFLAFSILAAKRGLTTVGQGKKSIYYLGGLTEGAETILFLCLFTLWPAQFPIFATIFAAMCWITIACRIMAARQVF